ncbi:hypothetical protein P3W33_05445 [Luteibacter sp. PPL552]
MTEYRSSLARPMDPYIVWAIGAVVVLAALVVAKNLWVDNAVVFHDEYLYRVWSDVTLSSQDILQRDLAPPLPNKLFFWVYGLSSHAGGNAYDLAQLINVVFWIGTISAALGFAYSEGVRGPRFGLLALAAALLPLVNYTKYFMPEMMYACMFTVAAWLVVEGARRDTSIWFVAAGAATGAMYYIKPHALIALGIDLVFVLFLPRRWRMLGGLTAGFAVAFASIRVCFPPVVASPGGLGIYTDILRSLSTRMSGYQDHVGALLIDWLHVAIPHVAMLVLYAGVPLVAAVGRLFPQFDLYRSSPGQHHFSRYLLIATFGLIGMAVSFTVFAGEIGRIHSRYYMFLMPLWLVELARSADGRFSTKGKWLVLLLVALSVTWLLVEGNTYSSILALSLVSDGPEWGALFGPRWLTYACLFAVMGASLLAVFRRHLAPLLTVIMTISVIATVVTTVQQKGVFRNTFVDGKAAIATRQWIGPERVRRTMIVARDRVELDKFLFFFQGAPFVALLPDGSNAMTLLKSWPTVETFVFLSPGYVLPGHLHCQMLDSGEVRICDVTSAVPQ